MTLLQSFDANFIVRVLTLKGLIETDTLYLVFKDRIVFGFELSLFGSKPCGFVFRSELGWVKDYSSGLYEDIFLPSKRAF
jgi:hypothetical protein